MAFPTHRYGVYWLAGAVVLAGVMAGWGGSSPAGAASTGSPNEFGNACGAFVERGSGVTKFVVHASVKKDEDTWVSRPEVLPDRPGYLPGFGWETAGGFFRGCSNAVAFAAAGSERGTAALLKIILALPFGAPNSRVAECHVVSEQGARFTCRLKFLDTLNGRLRTAWLVTSP